METLSAYSTPTQPVTSGQAIVFDQNTAQNGTDISHTANSSEITISQPGTYFASYSGTASTLPGTSLPVTNTLNLTLNGSDLPGAVVQHNFTTTGETSPQSFATLFTVTSVPATLKLISSGETFYYSTASLNVVKVG